MISIKVAQRSFNLLAVGSVIATLAASAHVLATLKPLLRLPATCTQLTVAQYKKALLIFFITSLLTGLYCINAWLYRRSQRLKHTWLIVVIVNGLFVVGLMALIYILAFAGLFGSQQCY